MNAFNALTVPTLTVLLCLVNHVSLQKDDSQDHHIIVQPGGTTQTDQVEWGGVTCKLTYKCVGGTNEDWVMRIADKGDKCVIERPEGVSSYLYFMEFEVEVTGAEIVTATIQGTNRGHIKVNEEFKVEKHKVNNAPGFKNSLNQIDLTLARPKPKKEL